MIDQFLNYLRFERNRSPRTVQVYEENLRDFETYIQGVDDCLSLLTADADVIRGWVERLMDEGKKPATVNLGLSALRTFYRYALARKLIEKDPAHAVTGPKKAKPLPQFVRESEMDTLLDEKLKASKPVILTQSFAAKAFLEKTFPDRKDSFLFCDSALAVFGAEKRESFDKLFAFGPVGGDAMECEKTGCVDIAVNPRELARIMIRTGSEPNPKRTAVCESLDLPKASGKYGKLLDKAVWNMDKEPECFELDGLKCVICRNLGQARRALTGEESFDVIRVIA